MNPLPRLVRFVADKEVAHSYEKETATVDGEDGGAEYPLGIISCNEVLEHANTVIPVKVNHFTLNT